MSDANTVRNNETEKRFEVEVDGQIAFLDYMWTGQTITYTHTEVPASLEGRGVGSQLVRHALLFAQENDLKVIPLCPFVLAYLRRHPEFRPVVFGYKPPA